MKIKTTLWARITLLCALALALVMPQRSAHAAEMQPGHHFLSLQHVTDGERGEFVWSINDLGIFKSLKGATLRSLVARLPEGDEISFSPSCLRIGGEEPYMAEVSDFARFCKEKKLAFTYIPAG